MALATEAALAMRLILFSCCNFLGCEIGMGDKW